MSEEKNVEKTRSLAYPAASIEECLEVLEIIKSLGGKPCAPQAIAEKLGVSITTYSFKAKISSSKQYNFIDNARNVIQLTEHGRSLIYPTANVNASQLLLDSFQHPQLYAKLIQAYEGKALPAEDRLANELLKPNYGLTVAAKDIAAKCFYRNAEYVHALENGILSLARSTQSEEAQVEDNNTASPNVSEHEQIDCKSLDTQKTKQSVGYRFQIPMLSGAIAEIFLPADIKVIDLEFFEQSINYMLPMFIKNLKDTLEVNEDK